MAAPQNPAAGLHQEPLADYILVRTDEIDVGDRLREIDLAWADAVGAMMARDGQDTAIGICRLPGQSRWTIVFGGHRHKGAELHDIVYLKAEVVSADRDDRREREARENLFRSDLSPMDRAAHIAEIVAIKKRRAGLDPSASGRQVGAAARWQAAVKEEASDATATLAVAYGFSDAVAADLGLSGRTVERGLMLYRRLAPSLIAKLRAAEHPAAKQQQQLETLAKLEALEQAKVVELLTVPGASLNYGQPKTVAEAIAHPLGPKPATRAKPSAEDKRLNAFTGAFQRMGVAERRGALEHLRPQLPPGTDLSNVERFAMSTISAARYREETLTALDDALLFLEGLDEDEVISGERASDLIDVIADLRLARLTVAGNGIELNRSSER